MKLSKGVIPMKNTVFKGMATAMVTPMTPHGVDYDTLARFIEFQIEKGIHALVAVGTTGESATLSPAERKAVIRFTVERVAGRGPGIPCGESDWHHGQGRGYHEKGPGPEAH